MCFFWTNVNTVDDCLVVWNYHGRKKNLFMFKSVYTAVWMLIMIFHSRLSFSYNNILGSTFAKVSFHNLFVSFSLVTTFLRRFSKYQTFPSYWSSSEIKNRT